MATELIMELTQEQGPGREGQVQPPLGVWIEYFGIAVDQIDENDSPVLHLRNARDEDANTEVRPIVEHNHNFTVEIAGAKGDRPAIIRIRRRGNDEYDYWVYRAIDHEYTHCLWLLDTVKNPLWSRGRKWLTF